MFRYESVFATIKQKALSQNISEMSLNDTRQEALAKAVELYASDGVEKVSWAVDFLTWMYYWKP